MDPLSFPPLCLRSPRGRQRDAPVLEPDRPWEAERVYIYGSVHWDDAAQRYKMWYLTRLDESFADKIEGLIWPWDLVLLAESEDGVAWSKPALGLHAYEGDAATNIVLLNKHSPTVLREEGNYRMAAWDWTEGRQGYWVASSADGTRWEPHPDSPIMTSDDEVLEAITVARHPKTGEYFGYHRRWGDESSADRAAGEAGLAGLPGRRLVAVSRSPDFENWSAPEVILQPDEEDDRWVQDPGQRSETPPRHPFCADAP